MTIGIWAGEHERDVAANARRVRTLLGSSRSSTCAHQRKLERTRRGRRKTDQGAAASRCALSSLAGLIAPSFSREGSTVASTRTCSARDKLPQVASDRAGVCSIDDLQFVSQSDHGVRSDGEVCVRCTSSARLARAAVASLKEPAVPVVCRAACVTYRCGVAWRSGVRFGTVRTSVRAPTTTIAGVGAIVAAVWSGLAA